MLHVKYTALSVNILLRNLKITPTTYPLGTQSDKSFVPTQCTNPVMQSESINSL